MKRFKKLTAGLMGVVMALGVCSFTAFAGDGTVVEINNVDELTAAIADQETGQVWEFVEGTYEINDALVITSGITIEGNNSEIVVNGTLPGTNGKKSAIEIIAGSDIDVEINDLKLDGNGGKAVHGINVYSDSSNEVAKVELNNVTITDFKEYGLVNNSSIVIANKLYTYGNKYGVNVDNKCNVEKSEFVMNDGEIEEEVSVYLENSEESANGTKATINGGTFKNVGYLTDGNTLNITNGTFANDVTEYMDDDSKLLKDEEGNYVVMDDKAFEKSDKEFYISRDEDLKAAVDNQADGVTWILKEGTYNGPITVTSDDVKIIGEGEVVLTFEDGSDFDPVAAIEGESFPYAGILTVNDADNVTVENIIIRGNIEKASAHNTLTHQTRYAGVAAINSSVTLDGCKIEDITYEGHLQGMQSGFGIYAVSENNEDLKVIDTDITNFNKTAIVARANINLVMDGCTIVGFGEQGIISQNGIQYAGNAKITDCVIEGLKYVADNEWTGGSVAIYNLGEGTTSTIKNVETKDVDYSVCDYGTGKTVIEGVDFDGLVYNENGNFAIKSGNFSSDVTEYLDDDSHLIKDKDGNFVVMDEEEYEDYLDDKKPSHSYELEEGRVEREDKEDEKNEPVVTPEEEAGPFSDVGKDNPNYDAIIKVYENGWMSGIGEGVFAPNGTLTRAMGATVLWNKAGKPEPQNVAPFLDVTGDAWYAKAVAWAYEQGIIAGYDATTFAPDDALTTEQFTRMNDIANGKTPEAYVGGAPNATRGWVASLLAM